MSLHEDESDLREFSSAGSRDAFNRIASRHLNFVYGIARREGGIDAFQAEDVTQAVFVIFARRAGSIRAASLSSWLFTTTRHVAANARKIEARRKHHEHRAAQARSEEIMRTGPADSIEHDQLSQHLTAALAAQRESDRAIVLMRFVQGLEFAQIAQTMGLSDLATRKRLERAIDRLRDFLIGRGITAESSALSAAIGGVAQAAPTSLAAAISSAAPAATAVALAKSTVATLVWTPLKLAASIVLAVTLTTVLVSQVINTNQHPPAPKPKSIAMNVAATAPAPTTAPETSEIVRGSPPGTVIYTGVITDPSGKPLEGARVWSELSASDPAKQNLAEASGVTDAAGRYTLPPLPTYTNRGNGGWMNRVLRFDDPRHAMAWSRVTDGEDLFDDGPETHSIRLETPAEIRVQVVDSEGKPIAGADVSVSLQHQGGFMGFPDDESYGHLSLPKPPDTLKTDAQGVIVLSRIPSRARAHVGVTHPDYISFASQSGYRGNAAPIRPGDERPYLVTLQRAGKIRARLDLADGTPMSMGGNLYAASFDKSTLGASTPFKPDDSAACVISSVPPGKYRVGLLARDPDEKRGRIWKTREPVTVREGETSEVTLAQLPGREVIGRAIDPRSNLPVAGATVSASLPPNPDIDGPRPIGLASVTTAADGRFSVWMTPGTIDVQFTNWVNGEHRPIQKKLVVAPQADTAPLDMGDIAVTPPTEIRARLVDAAGNGVAGAVIASFKRARTAADGTFVVKSQGGAPSFGDHVFYAFSQDRKLGISMMYDDKWTDPTLALPGAVLPTITLVPTANVIGKIVDENGAAVNDPELQLGLELPVQDRVSGIGYPRPPWGGQEMIGNQFAIHHLPVGLAFHVQFSGGGKRVLTKLDDLQPGEVRDLGEIALTGPEEQNEPTDKSGTVTGTIVDEHDKPLPGVRVMWYPTHGTLSHQTDDTSDQAGRFVLKGLPADEEVDLMLWPESYNEERKRIIVGKDEPPHFKLQPIAGNLIGQPAPELLTAQWLNGKEILISQLAGKVVLLHIGVRLPAGYVEGNRELLDAAAKYADKDVAIIAVHQPLDDPAIPGRITKEEIEAYLKAHPLPFPVAIDAPGDPGDFFGGQTKATYEIRNQQPAMIIIDRKGNVRAVVKRGEINNWIDKLLAEKAH